MLSTIFVSFASRVTRSRSILVIRAPSMESPTCRKSPLMTTAGLLERYKMLCSRSGGGISTVGAGAVVASAGGALLGGGGGDGSVTGRGDGVGSVSEFRDGIVGGDGSRGAAGGS